jgi:hypothetical protein
VRLLSVSSIFSCRAVVIAIEGSTLQLWVILTVSYSYLTAAGARASIENTFRVCMQFSDDKAGACLNPKKATDFFLVPGWGTYLPQDSKDLPWPELR